MLLPGTNVGIPFRYLLETFRVSTTDNSPLFDQEVVLLENRTFMKNEKAQQNLDLFCNGMLASVHCSLNSYTNKENKQVYS